MASLLSGLSGLTDKITSFIREPVSSLGNAINDAINSTYGVVSNDKYLRFADMVNSTSDPEVLEEVWFVLAKGIGSATNATVRTTMQICDVLMKNTGSRFHNSCTPLFMRRCKEMIIDRSKTGGADNMHVANDARNMIRLWGDAFMPYASSGRGRAIVEGYQDMQRDGIRFPPLPNDTKWEPSINPPRRVPEPTSNSYSSSSSSYSSKPRKSSVAEEPAGDFDPKETYKMLKKLLVKYDNEGNSIFDNTKITTFVQNCIGNTRRLQRIIERESMKEDNETYLNHLLTLNDMFIKISNAYKKYQDSKKKASDDWSDDDTPVQKPKKKVTDDWSDDDSTPSSSIKVKASSSNTSEGPAIRSTGRRTKREDSVSSNTSKQTSKKASDSLFDDDDDSFSKKPSRVMNKNAAASLFDSDDEVPAPTKAKKSVPADDWEDEWGASSVVKNPKSISRKNMNKKATDDLFGDDDSFSQPQTTKQTTKQSKQPVSDDPFGFDFMSSAPTVSETNDIMDEMDITNIDFTSTAASTTTTTTKPAVVNKPVKTVKSKTAFDDLFDL